MLLHCKPESKSTRKTPLDSDISFSYRVESRIADAICKNNNLLKVGLRFEFTEVMDRVQKHLVKNIDNIRKTRAKSGGGDKAKEWKPARTLD